MASEAVNNVSRFGELSPERRALLAARLKQRGANSLSAKSAITGEDQTLRQGERSQQRPPIKRAPRDGKLPLSFAQQRLWFVDQLEQGSAAYNVPTAFRILGPLDVSAFKRCFNEIIRRHEILRTVFTAIDGEPIQVITPPAVTGLPAANLMELPQEAREREALRLADEEARRPFDLARGPLIEARLLQLEEQEHVILLTMHHIISDAWSTGILVKEAALLYEAFTKGRPSALPDLPLQYADFALWQRRVLQGETLDELSAYWKGQLGGTLPILELPGDRQRPAVLSYRGGRETSVLPKSLGDELKALCRREGVTPFMAALAVFQVLLHRYTGQEDVIVGTPIANRNHAQVESLIGFFINTLAFRTDLAGNPTFRELLRRVREVAFGAYAHQDLPFESLVDALQPERSLNFQPIFQVMFAFHNTPAPVLAQGDLIWKPLINETISAKFDLTLSVNILEDGLAASIEYSTDLFDASRIIRMLGHFHCLLKDALDNPDRRISDLAILPEAERTQLLSGWNDTGKAGSQTGKIHRLFEAQADRTPEATALIFADRQLTYRELNARANQLAHRLRQLGIGPDALVGICLERSVEMAVGVLGILKAGGAYVPLDPAYPAERLALMLEDAQTPVILTEQRLIEILPHVGAHLICLDHDQVAIARESRENPEELITGENLAYVIYTSGSTGKPKGIGLPHRALANLIEWHNDTLLTGARTLQFASLSFDASFHEMFSAWHSGGTVLMISEELRRDIPGLARFLSTAAIEKVTLPVVVLQQLSEYYGTQESLPIGFKEITTTGEQLQITNPIKRFFKEKADCPLHNHYGPSETHVVTAATLTEDPEAWPMHPPIGRPIWNTQVYILDRHLAPVPIGVPGELYLGGVSLARGYLNRPDLTAEKFIPDPFGEAGGERLYRTGDWGRYQSGGEIEYLGRIDHQVKIRGYRVELGEIETVLGEHPALVEVVVLAREDQPGRKYLTAYLVADHGPGPTVDELHSFLKGKLPDYMIPSHFVLLERLPLTPNGKVDARALPAPDRARMGLNEDFIAPRTEVEDLLAGIWAELLDVERVGSNENFFVIGGHSLLATQVISRINRAFSVDLPLRSLFETPTIAGLGQSIERARQARQTANLPPLVPLTRNGSGPLSFAQQRLWFMNQLEPQTAYFNIPLIIRLSGPLDVTALEKALNELAARHEILRTAFPLVGGEPMQQIKPAKDGELPVIDLSGLPEAERETAARQVIEKEIQQPFDLAEAPLWRVTLARLAEQDHIMVTTIHHIITDGWSNGIFINELSALYESYSQGRPPLLGQLPLQYADYAEWQRQWLGGEALEAVLSYWKGQLGDDLPMMQLPLDRPRPASRTLNGLSHKVQIEGSVTQTIKALSRQEGVTLYMALLAGYDVLLSHYTGQEDIIVGTPIANRRRAEIEGLIGFFVNTLVMRADLSGDPSFRELLLRIRQMTLDAYAHQDLPFEMLVKELHPERSLDRTPLFQVEFTLQHAPKQSRRLANLTVDSFEMGEGSNRTTAQSDLTLDLVEAADGLTGMLRYSTDLFQPETMTHWAAQYELLVRAIAANPDARLSELKAILRDADRQHQAAREELFKQSRQHRLKSIQRKSVRLN